MLVWVTDDPEQEFPDLARGLTQAMGEVELFKVGRNELHQNLLIHAFLSRELEKHKPNGRLELPEGLYLFGGHVLEYLAEPNIPPEFDELMDVLRAFAAGHDIAGFMEGDKSQSLWSAKMEWEAKHAIAVLQLIPSALELALKRKGSQLVTF